MQKIKIHKNAMELQGFDLEVLEAYPHNMSQGDIPNWLLRNSEKHKMFEMYPTIYEEISYELKHRRLLPSTDHL
jgi:hypothetical protein